MAWVITQDLRTKERRNELKQIAENLTKAVIQYSTIPKKYPQYKGKDFRIEYSDMYMGHHQILHTREMIEKCLPIMTNYLICLLISNIHH